MNINEKIQKIKEKGIPLGFEVYIPKGNGDKLEGSDWGYWHFERRVCNCEDPWRHNPEQCNMGGQNFMWQLDDIEFQQIIKSFYSKLRKNFIENKLRFQILKRDNFKCRYCGRGPKEGVVLEIDHVIPKSKGGTDSKDNLITSCKECNRGKGTFNEMDSASL